MFPPEPPLRTLDGFAILHRLGAGAVGEVFLARSRGGTLVAIKTIAGAHLENGSADDSAAVFAHEASVCARLRHPCIVQVRAFLAQPAFSALVFEYVPGVALGRVLRLLGSQKLRLPDRAAWHVVERVSTALAYAHSFRDLAGRSTPVVHRDVSPSNVLLDWAGGVKIADFGIAKVLGVSPATRLGVVKGTLGCMAPEQARGEAVDERADVYAAALLAWRLTTGRGPFGKKQKDEYEFLRAMRNPRIRPLAVLRPDLPEPLVAAIARALEPDARLRTISAAELAKVVRAHVDVVAGWSELAALLDRWKPDLEREVKPAPGAEVKTSSSSAGRVDHTLRYEEVALALDDDDAPTEAPTFEARALPTEPLSRGVTGRHGASRGAEGAFPSASGGPEPRALGPSSAPPVRVSSPAVLPQSPPPAWPHSMAPAPRAAAPSHRRSAALLAPIAFGVLAVVTLAVGILFGLKR